MKIKKYLVSFISIAMVTVLLQVDVKAAGSSSPSKTAFATKEELKTGWDLSEPGKIYGELVFGKNKNGIPQNWYILGSDNGVEGDNTVLFAKTPLQNSVKFNDNFNNYSYENSNLRKILNKYLENGSMFFSGEQNLMNETEVETQNIDDAGQTDKYTTNDKLYALSGTVNGNTIYAGSDNSKVIHSNYWGNQFSWLRTPYNFAGTNYINITNWNTKKIKYEITDNECAVQPAMNLKLSNVLFASSAKSDGSKATITNASAMSLRMNGSNSISSTVKYNDSQIVVFGSNETLSLVVQGKDGENDWYYSTTPMEITSGGVLSLTFETIKNDLNLSDSIDPSLCKIWIEKTGNDGLNYAKMAIYSIDPVSYIDANGILKNCENYKTIENVTTTWNEGWYIVDGDVTIGSRVKVNGNVHLILKDESKLTIYGGISVPKDNHIYIYGQEQQSGTLDVTQGIGDRKCAIGGDGRQSTLTYAGDITINGGIINAKAGLYSAAIGGAADGKGGNITINGGTITASGNQSPGIGGGWNGLCGNIVITGGNITAITDNYYSAAIGTGLQSYTPNGVDNDNIYISGGLINATGWYGIGVGYSGKSMSVKVSGGIVTGSINASTVNKECGIINNEVFGNYTLEIDYEIHNNMTLKVRNDAILIIPTDRKLTIEEGSIINNQGSIIVKEGGLLDIHGKIINGTLAIEENHLTTIKKLDNNGDVIEKTAFYEDGSSVKTEYKDDESIIVTKKDKDGQIIETTVIAKDGSTVKTENKKDGSTVVTKIDKEGKVTEIVETSQDGSIVKTENKSDGSTVVTKKDRDGQIIETTVIAKDGPTVKTENKKDGSTVVTKTDKDGKIVEKVTTYPNGSYIKDGFKPTMIEGNNSKYENGKSLIFRSNDEFINFIKVMINDKELDSKYYIVESGSIKVTLKEDYLNTLASGTYKISIVSTNGTANTNFTIPETKSEPVGSGDNNNILLMMNLLYMSIIGGYILLRKKETE